jgi:hypothetical protein
LTIGYTSPVRPRRYEWVLDDVLARSVALRKFGGVTTEHGSGDVTVVRQFER